MRHLSSTRGHMAVMAVTALLASGPSMADPVRVAPSSGTLRLAMSTLGDLSSFRMIASDTLAIVRKGDMAGARARIKDLETAWDKAEANLKPKDGTTWKVVDDKIDAALTDLRIPNPKPAACEASLKDLIAEMDRASKS